MRKLVAVLGMGLIAAAAFGAPAMMTTHSDDVHGLDGMIGVGDLISGAIGTELPGDTGWHPAVGDPLDKLPAFTDDTGIRATGLTGLMNDFPGAGAPAKIVQYDLAAATDVSKIQILTGNNGTDGRVFSTSVVEYSTDFGANWTTLGYFQSDPSGTLNNSDPNSNHWHATMVEIDDDIGGDLITGATNLIFNLYSVDNTGGQMRDPFDGVNPYTGVDDFLTAAFVSPLVFEIDVLPEPTTALLLVLGVGLIRRR